MGYDYEILYTVSNVLGTYSICKLISVFSGKEVKNQILFRLSYVLFFIATTVVHLKIKIPIVMFLCNILGMMCLTMNYECGIQKKIASVAYTYLIIVGIETIVVLFSGYSNLSLFSEGGYHSVCGLVFIKIITYIAALLLEKFNGIRCGEKLPLFYWFCILFVPSSSIFVMLLSLNSGHLPYHLLTVEITIFLVINFAVFYLYDRLSAKIMEENESEALLREQSNCLKQYELMKLSMDSIQSLRHDLSNHFMTIQMLLKEENYEKLDQYIHEITALPDMQKQYVNTGNITLDSILNYKIFEAEQEEITVNTSVRFLSDVELNAYDLTVIFGNLMDNAVRATQNKIINIKVHYEKGCMLLKISNDYMGNVKFDRNKNIISTKNDPQNHGIGLKNVKRIVEKYHGTVDIDVADHMFTVFVMLYL